jgi:hypothetical protein
MADKLQYEPKYWAAKPPVKKEVVVTRYGAINDRAGLQGKKIGVVGTGARLIIDANENAGGDSRVVAVVGYPRLQPIPLAWENNQPDRPQEEKEWWVDNGDYVDANVDTTKIKLIVEWDNATNSGTVVKV